MHSLSISPEIIERVVKRRGRLHIFEDLVPSETAVIVIDMQEAFCAEGGPAEVPMSRAIAPAIDWLNAGVRALGGHVIWVTHAIRSWGEANEWSNFADHIVSPELKTRTLAMMAPDTPAQAVWSALHVEPKDIQIVKNRYSALVANASQLERVLRSLGIRNLLITGTKTNICCESTCRDAMQMDFRPMMISDATAALSDREHQSALENVIQQFGDVYTVEEVLEVMRQSGQKANPSGR